MSKKARMNRGLDALFSDNFAPSAAQQEQDTKQQTQEDKNGITIVSISLVEPNKGQPRKDFDDEKIQELAESIKENGLLQPILVTPLDNGGYRIVAGERRWRAARSAGLKEVPVYVRELSEKQVMQLALIENIQRQDLTPIEEAMAYKQLMDKYFMTQQELAKAVGKSRSAIANAVRLLELAEPVQKYLDRGKLSVGHAKVLAGLSDEQIQVQAADLAVNGGLSVRELENEVKNLVRTGDKGAEARKKRASLKHEDPFLKEFEITVNDNSSIKTKAKITGKGDKMVNITIPKSVEAAEVLSALAEILVKY
ncbi:ParB/RepB/Spo0J family partition protein [Ruminococcus sp. FC2018]|uniref:ParB/RepB/Spo0J family partition protein n=1 Tax=Ruminococcus sp. FC2018 TaxID=1410617 RepID=UPI000491F110|nr:ParB/RepB/Spo0J family partition protein [Ruminococcus sp. FC2018]